MKYEVGDLVRIVEHPWNQHAGDTVIITKAEKIEDTFVYEFVIPEQRGSTPEHLIGYLVARGVTACQKIASKS
jgi:hypothetical protein